MIYLENIATIKELEEIIKQYCPENETWNKIIENEKEMNSQGVIGQKIMNEDYNCVGILQYYVQKGLWRDRKIIISIMTCFKKETQVMLEVHKMLIHKHEGASKLIHVLQVQEENGEVEQVLREKGFQKYRNGLKPRYGYSLDTTYFVIQCHKMR